MKIQTVKSPGGIEAWLVEEHAVPLMALRFAFEGGNAQDPAGKEGVANFLTAMLDEGAGDLTSSEFQERMEEIAMRMSFEDSRDAFYGSFETLTAEPRQGGRAAAARDRPSRASTRMRSSASASSCWPTSSTPTRDPEKVAAKEWFAVAFAGHPYGRPAQRHRATVGAITRDDLEAYRKRIFAKSNLKVVAVGDIDADAARQAARRGVRRSAGQGRSRARAARPSRSRAASRSCIEMNVPQSVARVRLSAPCRARTRTS